MKRNCLVTSLRILLLLICTGCRREFDPLSVFNGQWTSDIPFTYSNMGDDRSLTHDNRIYETANFLVFSDASSDDVKKTTSWVAEISFAALKDSFNIPSSAELGIIDRDSKVKIYIIRYKTNCAQLCFPCGFMIYSIDSPYSGYTDNFERVIKHELMHVFQYLFGLGLNGYDDWPEVWFHEGIAEYISGGIYPPITNHTQVSNWLSRDDHINPISIHHFLDYPVPLHRVGEYYPMFGLAVRYLLHADGHRKTILDVKRIYEALKAGDSFNDAFESHMGMSLEFYENHFIDLISNLL